MLSEIEMLRYQSVTHCLSEEAKTYVRNTRESEPSRMVGKHSRRSLVSWRVSSKTNLSISLESRGPETAFFLLSEYDERVLEIWDQPEPVLIEKHDKNGKQIKVSYTPDFLLLTQDGPLVVEVKNAKDVACLVEEYPLDWRRSTRGTASFVPAEKAFLAMGLRFEVFIYDADMQCLIANTELMLLARAAAPLSDDVRSAVKDVLPERFVWSLEELRARLELTTFTPLIQLIDEGGVKAELRMDLLSQPEGCLVACSEFLLKTGRAYLETDCVARDYHETTVSIDKVPTVRDAEHALKKLEAIKCGGKPRSVLRWKTLIAEGEREGLSPFQSLLPKYYLCGNRKRRIQKVVNDFLMDYLTGEHAKSPGLANYRSVVVN